MGQTLPPAGIMPSGPTNLQPAACRLIADADAAMPKQLLLMTDAETQLSDAAGIREGMLAKKIHLNVLALGRGEALAALREISAATGGRVMEALDPKDWVRGIERLAQAAAPDRIGRGKTNVVFESVLASMRPREVELWNRTWLKGGATLLAESRQRDQTLPMAARWTVGEDGAVLAFAFGLEPADVDSIAARKDARRMIRASMSPGNRPPSFAWLLTPSTMEHFSTIRSWRWSCGERIIQRSSGTRCRRLGRAVMSSPWQRPGIRHS